MESPVPSSNKKPFKAVSLSNSPRASPLYFTVNGYNKPNTTKYYTNLEKNIKNSLNPSVLAISIVQYFIEENDFKFMKINEIKGYRKDQQYSIIKTNINLCNTLEQTKCLRISQLRELDLRPLEKTYQNQQKLVQDIWGLKNNKSESNIIFLMNYIMNNKINEFEKFYSNIENNLKSITFQNDWRDILFFLPQNIKCALKSYWINQTMGPTITGKTRGNLVRRNEMAWGMSEGNSLSFMPSARGEQKQKLINRASEDVVFIINMIIPYLLDKFKLFKAITNSPVNVKINTNVKNTVKPPNTNKNSQNINRRTPEQKLANAQKGLSNLKLNLGNENW